MASERQRTQKHHGGAAASPWTLESVRSLGLTTSVEKAASILGISRTTAYALASQGEFPIKLVRIGRRYLVPIPPLLDLLTDGRPKG